MVDEAEDVGVVQMLDLFKQGFKFRKEMFIGGLTGTHEAGEET